MTTTNKAHRELGDRICEVLTFCYSDEHEKSLQDEATKMGATFEQFVAAALTQMISERFDFEMKTPQINN